MSTRRRIALAMPGGFEFGGIGRMMMYTTRAWGDTGPAWRLIDGRGTGSIMFLPLHLAGECGRIVVRRWRRQLDLVHLNVAGRGSTLRKIVLGSAAALVGVPTIVHLHDYDYAADYRRRGAFGRWLVRRLFTRARRVIVLGLRDRRTVMDELGVAEERIVVLHNAVPDPGAPPAQAAEPGPVQLVFLGHLSARKGVPELLEALARPEVARHDWRAVLAGGGEVERFRARGRELGLEGRVGLPGWRPHDGAYRLLSTAAVFVLPSHAEGQAMSLLEAMAHGLAIVTTPVGAHLEAVTDGAEAILTEPGDVAALAAALDRVLGDPALRARLGAAARRRYESAFDVTRYAARLAEIYEEVLQDAPTAAVPLTLALDDARARAQAEAGEMNR